MSLDQISVKPFSLTRGYSYTLIFIKLFNIVCLDDMSVKFDYGSCHTKTTSLGQISLKPCTLSLEATVLASVAQLDARPTGDQEVAGLTPAEVGNILSWRLIMKYLLRSFSPFR